MKPNCVKVEAIHRLASVTGHLQTMYTMFLAVQSQVKIQEDKILHKGRTPPDQFHSVQMFTSGLTSFQLYSAASIT